MTLNKNNKQTMNERTHNPFNRYQKNKNTNSNNQKINEEFGEEFEMNNKKRFKNNRPTK